MSTEYIIPLMGGVIIGLATTIMLIFNGRVTGVSGIINGAIKFQKGDRLWRFAFLIGLIVGGFMLKQMQPDLFTFNSHRPDWVVALAGLLVGYGTILGSGCTSGHGVCGISRLSIRSVLATITFIVCGVLSVTLFNLISRILNQ